MLSFCTSIIAAREDIDETFPRTYRTVTGFVPDSPEMPVQIGDFVLLRTIHPTKWQLGWLTYTRQQPGGSTEYLIESIEDGELGWCADGEIAFLQRRCVDPCWRWTDRQWEFSDRWRKRSRAAKAKHGYMIHAVEARFGDGFEVTLGTLTPHGLDDIAPSRTFPDWRKVTAAMMAQCFDECAAERERIVAERKADDARQFDRDRQGGSIES